MYPIIKATHSNSEIGLTLKSHIYKVYKEFYGAEVFANPDSFIYIEDHGKICACYGITFASNRKLFSEQYIAVPVENYINKNPFNILKINSQARFDLRYNIAEVGSCIAIEKGYGLKLYKILPIILNLYEINYSLITLTGKVQSIFDSLGFRTSYLVDADISRVSKDSNWGTFYDTNPKTFIFDIKNSLQDIPLFDYLYQVELSLSHELFILSQNHKLAS